MPYINEEEQNNAPLWILLVAVATVFVIAHITNIKKQQSKTNTPCLTQRK